jgi:hypothetical protein
LIEAQAVCAAEPRLRLRCPEFRTQVSSFRPIVIGGIFGSKHRDEPTAVANFDPNFAVLKFVSHRFATWQFLYRFFTLLLFVGPLGGMATADVSSSHVFSLGSSLSFSIADFDGDSRPDLAIVQAGENNAPSVDYWIQVQLSANRQQTFQVVAPIGGIQIASRDVDGDSVPDLVLTTTWLGQPVAILLNDGHGAFSRVGPDAFPKIFSEPQTSWGFGIDHTTDVVGAPPQSREGVRSEIGSFLYLRPRSRIAATSDSRLVVRLFLNPHLGRAPPVEVSRP